jgi:hypothetical protein
MNRHVALMLTGMTLLGAPACFGQSDPWLGTWQLNLAKSVFSPGPPPKGQTINVQGEGQSRRATAVGTNARGNPINFVQEFVVDGTPHPRTGVTNMDARAYTQVDAHNIRFSGMKDGKVVGTGTYTLSPDGKTWTITLNTDTNERQTTNIFVFDKQ